MLLVMSTAVFKIFGSGLSVFDHYRYLITSPQHDPTITRERCSQSSLQRNDQWFKPMTVPPPMWFCKLLNPT